MDPVAAPFAQVASLPGKYADKILSGRLYRLVRGFSTVSPLLLVGAVALAIFEGLPQFDPNPAAPGPAKRYLGIALLVLAGTTFLTVLVFARPNAWLRRIARDEIRLRPGRSVDPDSPEARFVEVVPRSNWNKGMRENAIDVGFLMVNAEQHCLLFEGDRERYLIPANAIVKAEQDDYTLLTPSPAHGTPNRTLTYRYFVVVTVRTAKDSTAEIPFRLRGLRGQTKQRTENFELLKAIHHLAGNAAASRNES